MAKSKKTKLPVLNMTGEEVGTVELNNDVFGVEPNSQVMFDAVQVYRSNCRQATAKTKVRSEVSGGGKKPWKQKGTGRARSGSSRSPIWVGGGTVFGPDGRQNYRISMNKTAHRLALCSALTLKAKENNIIVLENLELTEPKTSAMVKILNSIGADKKILLVLGECNENVILAARNLPNVLIVPTTGVSVYDLLDSDKVVLTKDAIKMVEEALL